MASNNADASDSGRPGPTAVIIGGASRVPPRVLAPWLGSQKATDRLAWMSEITGLDLIELGTVATQDELSNPEVTRPIATALAILVGEQLLADADPERVIIAGHGSGEIAAGVLAGVLGPEQGLGLAVQVGQAEAAACVAAPSGQVALLGGYPPEIENRIRSLGLSVAAYNGGGDIVISGPRPALDVVLKNPPGHTRAEGLPAIGAFGSQVMAGAAAAVRASLPSIAVRDLRFRLVSGSDGQIVTSGHSWLESLINQLTGPVHWDLTLEQLAASSAEMIMELPPAGALSGLVTRGLPGATAIPVNTPELLAKVRTQLVDR